jgi:hypothetical protein
LKTDSSVSYGFHERNFARTVAMISHSGFKVLLVHRPAQVMFCMLVGLIEMQQIDNANVIATPSHVFYGGVGATKVDRTTKDR